MSRIDELTRELCPDGVHVRTLDAVITALRTGLNPRQNFKLNAPGATHHYITVRELGGFEIRPTEKTDLVDDEGLSRIQARSKLKIGDVLFSGTGTIGRTALVAEEPTTWNIKEGVYAITPDPAAIDARYLVYVLHSTSVRSKILAAADGSTVASVPMATLRNIRIPVPPLEVQREIVRVLDQFTQLEAELEAELEARRRQYEHYRTEVFTFSAGDDVRWSTLGGVSAKVSSGGTPSSGRDAYYGGDIPWLRTQEVDFGPVHRTGMTITEEGLRSSSAKWIPEHCVIVAMYGATAAKVAINEIPLTTNQACCNLQIDPAQAEYRYVFFWIASQYERLKSLGEGSQSNLNARKVKDFPIPVPSLEEQRRIVSLLDKFDALVNDLSVGLPAELAARRKQYEYYRDELLTFEEAAA